MDTYTKKTLELVEFNEDDVSGLIELSASVGWDYDEHEIKTIMLSGKVVGHKNAKGKIVSSAAIIMYDAHLASIGMVIVHSNYRGLGLGKKVTQKCIDVAPSDASIMLIATEDGKSLYEKMGFKTVDYVHKYLCDHFTSAQPNSNDITIEDFSENDFTEIVKLDKIAFGDRRKSFLHHRINQSEQCVVVKDSKANMIGYGISILGPINLLLGPIVAPDNQTAAIVLDRLAMNHQGKLRIDVPLGHDEFMMLLEKSGFIKVSEPPIMIKNAANMPPRNHKLFAIAAQIFG